MDMVFVMTRTRSLGVILSDYCETYAVALKVLKGRMSLLTFHGIKAYLFQIVQNTFKYLIQLKRHRLGVKFDRYLVEQIIDL